MVGYKAAGLPVLQRTAACMIVRGPGVRVGRMQAVGAIGSGLRVQLYDLLAAST